MTHIWTHNPSRIIRSQHLFSLTLPLFHRKMHLSIFASASYVCFNTLFAFFHESYLRSVWGVYVCIAELECLRMSEICNFTISFINAPVGTSSPLALSLCISPVCQSPLRVYRAVPPSANLYVPFPPLNDTFALLWTALSMQDLMSVSLSHILSRPTHCDNRWIWQ